jgi:putative CocE/NonD family hydrolase
MFLDPTKHCTFVTMRTMIALAAAACLFFCGSLTFATVGKAPVSTSQEAGPDFTRRVVDIPMRDGVTLHTVIVIPTAIKDAPVLLTRTPYGADEMAGRSKSGTMAEVLAGFDNATDVIVEGGYIRVIQDIRGRFGSEGAFVTTRPLAGTWANQTGTDESTDAWDTIEWLVHHVPEANGKVGIIGISYDGFEALMAMVNPHPALKVAVPINPMVDGWMGDDWFHNGAFRQVMSPVIDGGESEDAPFKWTHADQYDAYLVPGSAAGFRRAHGLGLKGFWADLVAHPSYDSFWGGHALDRILASRPLTVPVMLVHSLWDQEDIYGASAVYRALEPQDAGNDRVYLTIGPWRHGQAIEDGRGIGAIEWDHDTAAWWRRNVLAPFLAHYLKDAPMDVAPVTAFQSGTGRWVRRADWPSTRGATPGRLYLKPDMALGFDPAPGPARTVRYVSNPADPVPFVERPFRSEGDDTQWQTWLVSDQRHTAARKDVLSFVSAPIEAPLAIAGRPVVNLRAATSGTDSDWVVKLIDVHPDGYQLPIGMEIYRGRYWRSFAKATRLPPNRAVSYRFALPDANHVFLPGHRLMVQVQSSWFPLYDRNPQRFVPNIFVARPEDHRAARQTITVAGPHASFIELPIAPSVAAQ